MHFVQHSEIALEIMNKYLHLCAHAFPSVPLEGHYGHYIGFMLYYYNSPSHLMMMMMMMMMMMIG